MIMIRPTLLCALSLGLLLACNEDDDSATGPAKVDTVTVIKHDTLVETDTLRIYDTTEVSQNGKPLEIRFFPRFGSEGLELGKRYRNAADDSVWLTMARFYVSEFGLVDTLGRTHPTPGLFLVDFADTSEMEDGSYAVTLKALPGKYRGVKFSVGVPYKDNHQDVATQKAPLGPNAEMFWVWNSGYIFHRVEGKVDSAGKACNWFFHVGADNRKLSVGLYSLPNPFNPTAEVTTLEIGEEHNAVEVEVDYAKLFTRGLEATGPIRVMADTTERMAHGGALADRVFLNMQSMFTRKGTSMGGPGGH